MGPGPLRLVPQGRGGAGTARGPAGGRALGGRAPEEGDPGTPRPRPRSRPRPASPRPTARPRGGRGAVPPPPPRRPPSSRPFLSSCAPAGTPLRPPPGSSRVGGGRRPAHGARVPVPSRRGRPGLPASRCRSPPARLAVQRQQRAASRPPPLLPLAAFSAAPGTPFPARSPPSPLSSLCLPCRLRHLRRPSLRSRPCLCLCSPRPASPRGLRPARAARRRPGTLAPSPGRAGGGEGSAGAGRRVPHPLGHVPTGGVPGHRLGACGPGVRPQLARVQPGLGGRAGCQPPGD